MTWGSEADNMDALSWLLSARGFPGAAGGSRPASRRGGDESPPLIPPRRWLRRTLVLAGVPACGASVGYLAGVVGPLGLWRTLALCAAFVALIGVGQACWFEDARDAWADLAATQQEALTRMPPPPGWPGTWW